MDKVIILKESLRNDWIYDEWNKNGINAECIFKKINMPLRLVRRIWIKYNLPFKQIWYTNWKEEVKNSEIIIVHISYLTMNIFPYLHRINPDAKFIAWYWNSIEDRTIPTKIKGECDKWSFDFMDCQKYQLKYNHQYYFKSATKKSNKILWDIYFCGKDKGRSEKIIGLYKEFQRYKLKVKIQVVPSERKDIPKEIVSERISYDEIKDNISISKAILELTSDGQSGFTLRLMESIFFGKKLITDNIYVKKESFYNENNIFVLGERDLSELNDFLNSEFIPYNDEVLDRYDVRQWILNFIND